jgi:SAM-dependent methyltransferase
MNTFHRWYCRTGHWRRTVEERLLPWALAGVDLGPDVLEIGPGPGVTTDALAHRIPRLTALEIDATLATALRRRHAAVRVVEGDATALPFPDGSFSGAVAFTMLHHVPSPEAQDRLLGEVHRVLRPGGLFAGSDSTPSLVFRLAHFRDTMQLVDPDGFAERLARAGFRDPEVRTARGAFRFRARR